MRTNGPTAIPQSRGTDPHSADSGEEIGREPFRLLAKARAAGRNPEIELRAVAHRYRDLVHAWERSQS